MLSGVMYIRILNTVAIVIMSNNIQYYLKFPIIVIFIVDLCHSSILIMCILSSAPGFNSACIVFRLATVN